MDDEEVEELDGYASLALEAFSLTHGARQVHYGPPWEDHARVAMILDSIFDGEFTITGPVDVQLFLVAVKLARLGHAYINGLPFEMWRDHLVDLIGYVDCLWRTVEHYQAGGEDDGWGDEPDPEPDPIDSVEQ